MQGRFGVLRARAIARAAQLRRQQAWNRANTLRFGLRRYLPALARALGSPTISPTHPAFIGALTRWQRRSGMRPTGVISPVLLPRLLRLVRPRRPIRRVWPAWPVVGGVGATSTMGNFDNQQSAQDGNTQHGDASDPAMQATDDIDGQSNMPGGFQMSPDQMGQDQMGQDQAGEPTQDSMQDQAARDQAPQDASAGVGADSSGNADGQPDASGPESEYMPGFRRRRAVWDDMVRNAPLVSPPRAMNRPQNPYAGFSPLASSQPLQRTLLSRTNAWPRGMRP